MDKLYNIERMSEIFKMLEQNGRVDVSQLSTLFKASRETIRRDLREMEEKGLLKRTHGGAVFSAVASPSAPEFPVGVREIQMVKEKEAICESAAALIQDGDNIFVDNSSTCLYLLRHLPADRHITLITNSIKLLLVETERKHDNVMSICLGGFFNVSNLSTYGDMSRNSATDFYPDKSFMSCAGIQPDGRMTDSSILEVETKRLMIERARQAFILADHTKFGRSGPVFLCEAAAIHTLITDVGADLSQLATLEQTGLRVTQAALPDVDRAANRSIP